MILPLKGAGTASVAGTPSLSPASRAGRLNTTQCDQVPPGASGSSHISASVRDFSGTPDHARSGDRSEPSQVNLLGIIPSSVNAELRTWIVSRSGDGSGSA